MTKVTVDTDGYRNQAFICRLNYVLTFIQNHPNSPDHVHFSINEHESANLTIHYSIKGGTYHIIPQKVFFEPSINSKLKVSEHKFQYKELSLKGFAHHGGSAFIEFDIFETIFFHISRYEERNVQPDQLDQHGSMTSIEHYLVKNKMHTFPIADLLVYYFFEKLGLKPNQVVTNYTLTHDIDSIHKYPSFYKFLRGYGNIALYQDHKIKNFVRHSLNYVEYMIGTKTDPYDTFDWLLIKNNDKVNQKIIYWLTGGNTIYEGFFNIHNPKVYNTIHVAKGRGYKIGLHPSYDTISNASMMRQERFQLCHVSSEDILDSRQHFLRFDIQNTGKILDELGIKTDSSLGYRDRIGFRCGTGFPYHLYDFDRECAFKFVEIPLIVMDIAAMREIKWDSAAWCLNISAFIEKNNMHTHITFNFHNSFF